MCMSLKALLCSGDDALSQHWNVLRAIHTLNPPKNCRPSIQRVGMVSKASCGVLGGHFCWRPPLLAMVVLVVVGHWRPTSDLLTVGIVAIVYGRFFIPT